MINGLRPWLERVPVRAFDVKNGMEENWWLCWKEDWVMTRRAMRLCLAGPVRTHGLPTFFGEEHWMAEHETSVSGGPNAAGWLILSTSALCWSDGGRPGCLRIAITQRHTDEESVVVLRPAEEADLERWRAMVDKGRELTLRDAICLPGRQDTDESSEAPAGERRHAL
jgi:hypothetical protein